MMDESTEELTGELAEMLETNDADSKLVGSPKLVDPREIPTRFSLLKAMALSPAHYFEQAQRAQDDSIASRLATMASSRDRKDALRFGSATHAMLFGTGTVAMFTKGRRAGQVWIDFQRQAAAEGHVEILNEREYRLACEIVTAIHSNPTAMRLLFDGTIVEKRIDWEWMGKACRSTPDARKVGEHVTDLKTAMSAHPETFRRHALRLYYEAQSSFYGTCLEEVGEPLPENYYVIAVEKTRPHPVTVLRFTPDAMELGAKLIRLWFERLLLCEGANVWPGYAPPPAIVDLDIDHWDAEDGGSARRGRALEINGKLVAL